ncbi:MAG TPA: phytoene/squalene synthase family protein [Candidatus Dormibacteraeota bacterium]|nr:phytoene/squalene synthase family protein [Candidatus Dormibacteraeota bacterium]
MTRGVATLDRAAVDLVATGTHECAHIARHEARTFYYAFLLLPPRRRRAIHAVYAFSRAVDDVADDGALSAADKLRRLDAHRATLESVYAGRPGTPRLAALAEAVARHSIPRSMLETLVDGVAMDVLPRRNPDVAALRAYCHAVAGVVGQMCVRIFGATDPRADGLADELGFALQLTNILRDVGEDWAGGRFYLPLDELAGHGLNEQSLLAHDPARGDTPQARFLRLQGERAERSFGAADELLPLVPAASRPCLAGIAGLYHDLLVRLRQRGFPVSGERVRLSGGEKARSALRAAVHGLRD